MVCRLVTGHLLWRGRWVLRVPTLSVIYLMRWLCINFQVLNPLQPNSKPNSTVSLKKKKPHSSSFAKHSRSIALVHHSSGNSIHFTRSIQLIKFSSNSILIRLLSFLFKKKIYNEQCSLCHWSFIDV